MRQILFLLTLTFLFSQCVEEGTTTTNNGIAAPPAKQEQKAPPATAQQNKKATSPALKQKQTAKSAFTPNIKGYFVYAADAALFYPCGEEGVKYPVIMNKAYKTLERSYTRLSDREFAEKVYVELIGELELAEGMESGQEKSLKIKQMVRMKRNTKCE